MHRFAGPGPLCSWAGLTPRHYESDTVVHRGHITKQGSKLVRWATVEAIQRKTTVKIGADRKRIEARRGKNIAKIAAARNCSPSSTTAYATEKSGRWLGTPREPPGRGIRVVVAMSDPRNGVVSS